MTDLKSFVERLGLLKLGNLTCEKLLGTGGQATVCSYRTPKGQTVAAKFLLGPRDSSTMRRFRDEAAALRRCAKFKNVADTRDSESAVAKRWAIE